MDVDAYIGEIRMFSGNYAPEGWAICDGNLLPISGNETLFAIIGTVYGGDGANTFALPDLRSRVPVHSGQGLGLTNIPLGQSGGTEKVTITAANMPAHTHTVNAVNIAGTTGAPTLAYIANSSKNAYVVPGKPAPAMVAMNSESVSTEGIDDLTEIIVQPYIALTFIIATSGIYPTN